MASEEDAKLNLDENLEWNVENEIRLFEAMIGHKPVGINKHFHMACISEKFETLMGKPVSSELIWKHLGSMFDLTALDKKESLPFPNEPEEFSLPETEFSELINEKLALKTESLAEARDNAKEGKTTLKTSKDSTPAKETVIKKERKSDVEESALGNEGEKKDSVEYEGDSKRLKVGKEEKPEKKRRGPRSTKEKKEDDNSQTLASSHKKEDEHSSVGSGSKKGKHSVGKRSLRSRVDDGVSSKSLTPPPIKRPRRL